MESGTPAEARTKELAYIDSQLKLIHGYNENDQARIDDLRGWLTNRRGVSFTPSGGGKHEQ